LHSAEVVLRVLAGLPSRTARFVFKPIHYLKDHF
jgi:hypothetical protein